MAMSVQVDGGTVRLDSPLLGEEGWIVECGLEDGSLKGSARNTSGTGAVRWVVLTLLEDGTLQITIQREDGDPHAFYCAR